MSVENGAGQLVTVKIGESDIDDGGVGNNLAQDRKRLAPIVRESLLWLRGPYPHSTSQWFRCGRQR